MGDKGGMMRLMGWPALLPLWSFPAVLAVGLLRHSRKSCEYGRFILPSGLSPFSLAAVCPRVPGLEAD